MELEKLVTLIKLLDGKTETSDTGFPLKNGDKCFIRTVTLYYTGEIVSFKNGFVEIKDAAWIADTGRFHDFLKNGMANEVEPFIGNVFIPVNSIIDVTQWDHALPKEQK